ncbi:MAG: helix-turn-helix transcriptional regulator [Erythrobacter sp.]|nr:helix-turn-helix transcriptional regulator [Erythrobacter sp.]
MDFEESTTDICQWFGQRVRHRRRAMDLSQEELAERADIHRTYLASLESTGGRNPTIRVVERIAAALEVTPGDLLNMPPIKDVGDVDDLGKSSP